MKKHVVVLYSSEYQTQSYPHPSMLYEILKAPLKSLQATCGSSELFSPYYPPNSFNLVCPNGIRFLKVFPSQVILTSFFEYAIFMVYPSSANCLMHNGRWRGLIQLFMSITFDDKVIRLKDKSKRRAE